MRTVMSVVMSIGDIFATFARNRLKRYLIILPVLFIVALLLSIISSSGVLAPFLYPLF